MVDVEEYPDERYAILKTDKKSCEYRLVKDMTGHRFFEFRVSKGFVPEELSGKYTSLEKGIEAFKQFEKNLTKSKTVKRDEWQAEKEAKRAKLHTETS